MPIGRSVFVEWSVDVRVIRHQLAVPSTPTGSVRVPLEAGGGTLREAGAAECPGISTGRAPGAARAAADLIQDRRKVGFVQRLNRLVDRDDRHNELLTARELRRRRRALRGRRRRAAFGSSANARSIEPQACAVSGPGSDPHLGGWRV
jgi:hypothetical protein